MRKLALCLLLSSLGALSAHASVSPEFGRALISEIEKFDPAARLSPEERTPARLYLERALSDPAVFTEAENYLATLGAPGEAARQRLLTLASAPKPQTPHSPSLDRMAEVKLDEASLRLAFDGGALKSQASDPLPAAPAPKTEEKPRLNIVSVSMEKLAALAKKELYSERKQGLDGSFGVAEGGAIGGAGVFSAKILKPEEVAADPVKQGARDEAAQKGEKIVFIRTNTKAQLFGSYTLPIGGAGPVSAGAGLRLGGVIEIVETRAIPRDAAGAYEHAKERVFRWPLTVAYLKNEMRVGEDLTITGRLERGAGLTAGVGERLGLPAYAAIGAGAAAGAGHAEDDWVSLHLRKIDAEHVRVLIQKGDGSVVSANVSVFAGLNIYDDSFIPHVGPTSVDDSLIGKAVLSGRRSIAGKLADLARAELAASWSAGKHDIETEGWGAVPLSDPRTAAALEDLLKADPKALRALSADATFSKALAAGRLEGEIRDVTSSSSLQARLSALHLVKSAGTAFYEIRWRTDEGKPQHYLVGVANERYHGDVTKTNRAVESVMWYDLNKEESSVLVKLGPENRLFTTTRERINDVIAGQKALGLDVDGRIKHPHPYLEFFGLGNYGRSVEKGQFVLPFEGIQAIKKAAPADILVAYLRADWLFEKQSFPPGYIWGERESPPWAATADPAALKPVLDFLRVNAGAARGVDRDEVGELSREYSKLAPGRRLLTDAARYRSAAKYAEHVQRMQCSENPEELIELFLKFRRDHDIELKRAVAATAAMAGSHYSGYLEMTGKRVALKPSQTPAAMPRHPLEQVNALFTSWR